VAQSVR